MSPSYYNSVTALGDVSFSHTQEGFHILPFLLGDPDAGLGEGVMYNLQSTNTVDIHSSSYPEVTIA